MARTGRVNHTHQYFRHSNGLWHCSGIEGCSHHVPKNMPEPVGRKSICWSCGGEFQLLQHHMQNEKPFCDECQERSDRIEAAFVLPEVKYKGSALDEIKRRAAANAAAKFKVVEPEPTPDETTFTPEDEIEVYEPTDE